MGLDYHHEKVNVRDVSRDAEQIKLRILKN